MGKNIVFLKNYELLNLIRESDSIPFFVFLKNYGFLNLLTKSDSTPIALCENDIIWYFLPSQASTA